MDKNNTKTNEKYYVNSLYFRYLIYLSGDSYRMIEKKQRAWLEAQENKEKYVLLDRRRLADCCENSEYKKKEELVSNGPLPNVTQTFVNSFCDFFSISPNELFFNVEAVGPNELFFDEKELKNKNWIKKRKKLEEDTYDRIKESEHLEKCLIAVLKVCDIDYLSKVYRYVSDMLQPGTRQFWRKMNKLLAGLNLYLGYPEAIEFGKIQTECGWKYPIGDQFFYKKEKLDKEIISSLMKRQGIQNRDMLAEELANNQNLKKCNSENSKNENKFSRQRINELENGESGGPRKEELAMRMGGVLHAGWEDMKGEGEGFWTEEAGVAVWEAAEARMRQAVRNLSLNELYKITKDKNKDKNKEQTLLEKLDEIEKRISREMERNAKENLEERNRIMKEGSKEWEEVMSENSFVEELFLAMKNIIRFSLCCYKPEKNRLLLEELKNKVKNKVQASDTITDCLFRWCVLTLQEESALMAELEYNLLLNGMNVELNLAEAFDGEPGEIFRKNVEEAVIEFCKREECTDKEKEELKDNIIRKKQEDKRLMVINKFQDIWLEVMEKSVCVNPWFLDKKLKITWLNYDGDDESSVLGEKIDVRIQLPKELEDVLNPDEILASLPYMAGAELDEVFCANWDEIVEAMDDSFGQELEGWDSELYEVWREDVGFDSNRVFYKDYEPYSADNEEIDRLTPDEEYGNKYNALVLAGKKNLMEDGNSELAQFDKECYEEGNHLLRRADRAEKRKHSKKSSK